MASDDQRAATIRKIAHAADVARLRDRRDLERQSLIDLDRVGWAAYDAGRIEDALAAFAALAALHRRRRDPRNQADMLMNVARMYRALGRPQEALASFTAAGELLESAGSALDVARVKLGMAELHNHQLREFDTAKRLYGEARDMFQAVGATVDVAYVLRELGELASEMQQDDDAHAHFAEALKLYESVRNTHGRASVQKAIGQFRQRRGLYDEAHANYLAAFEIFGEMGDKLREAIMAQILGELETLRGQHLAALEWNEKARAQFAEIGDTRREALVMLDIADTHEARGALAEAFAAFEGAYNRLAPVATDWYVSRALHGMAVIHERRGEFDAAISRYEESLKIREELGIPGLVTRTLTNLGNLHRHRRDYDRALDIFTRSLDAQRELGDKSGEAIALANLATVHQGRHDFDAAEAAILEAFEIFKTVSEIDFASRTLLTLREILRRRTRDEAATAADEARLAELADGVLPLIRESTDKGAAAHALCRIARLRNASDDFDAALALLDEAVAIFESIGDPDGRAFALETVARTHEARDDFEAALAVLGELAGYYESTGNRADWGRVQIFMGRTSGDLKRFDDARAHFTRAIATFREQDDRELLTHAMNRFASLEADTGDLHAALKILAEINSIAPNGTAYYDIACYYGRAITANAAGFPPPEDLLTMALDALELALANGWDRGTHMDDDDDMIPFRELPRYQEIRSRLP